LRCASLIALLIASQAHAAPALQVRIMLERVDHSLVAVSPLHEFHSGDRIHLRIAVSQPADIYVLSRTEADFSIDPIAFGTGTPHLIAGPVHVRPGETDLDTITFDEPAGIEKLAVVATSRPGEPPTVIELVLRHAN